MDCLLIFFFCSASSLCMEQLAGLLTPGQIPLNGRKRADAGDQKRKRMKSDADSSRLSSPTFPRTPVANSGIVPGDQVFFSPRPMVSSSSASVFPTRIWSLQQLCVIS
jgi:hypothetical protein